MTAIRFPCEIFPCEIILGMKYSDSNLRSKTMMTKNIAEQSKNIPSAVEFDDEVDGMGFGIDVVLEEVEEVRLPKDQTRQESK